ncbi:TRL1 [Sanghuangporus sanghuang]
MLPHAERTNPNLLFANFNQDFTCISIGTKKGYSITNVDPFGRVYTMNDGARGIVEMLFCTSLIALVGAADEPESSPRKLQIVNTKRQSMICELLFPSSILAVKLNRKTLVVVLENEIYIYDISNMRLMHVIETTPNPEAVCALSPAAESSYLAYPSPVPSPTQPLSQQSTAGVASTASSSPPSSHTQHHQSPHQSASSSASSSSPASSQSGDVILFSTRKLIVENVIQAHKSPISFLSINSTGTLLATASEKGTVIRVWGIPGSEKLYQFRRGTREARIYSMNFNFMSTLLAVSSAHETVHIFSLGGQKGGAGAGVGAGNGRNGPPPPLSPSPSIDSRDGAQGMEGGYEAFIDGKKSGSMSSFLRRRSLKLTKNITSSVGGYLPNTLTEMWEPSRDFAYLKLPVSGARCIVAISGTMPHVMVISSEGYFYSYNIDLENGGECTLMKQYRLAQRKATAARWFSSSARSKPSPQPNPNPISITPATTTMASPLPASDHALVSSLLALLSASSKIKNRNKRLASSSTYPAPADPSVSIRSWRLNEYKYYDVPSPFPTLARGLFTQWVSEEGPRNGKEGEGQGEGRYRIVARGYDKFFNIGEVPWCTWDALEKHTAPPYVMTLKSNGCIIFIAALTPSKLLVTSKHSLGPVQGSEVSHAEMGERWLVRQLGRKGKTVEELAAVLWENNWTAVAELCDDSFEEHVLPYSPEKTGLHLHGINESTGAFHTLPSDAVARFAREWGLIETPFHIVRSIAEVRAFSDEVARRGEWMGEAIEGFVVRCHVGQNKIEANGRDRDAPPYPPGSSFFFKVKYDEPYMTYRDWREITKILLASKQSLDTVSIPKSKLRRPESHLYLKWVREEIKKNREAFREYSKGKGIIATRERFLEWLKVNHPEQQILATGDAKMDIDVDVNMNMDEDTEKHPESKSKPKKKFGKTIIVPVAIPGCGKTTLAVALTHLFGFGHVQSDDIPGKKAAQEFVKRVKKELDTHDVVIADKNNHLVQHRLSLRDAVKGIDPPVRLLALYWPIAEKPRAMVHRICSDRVLQRGDNHQTLRPSEADVAHHESVIWMFIQNTQELAESEVDEVVEMPLEDDGGDGKGMEESLARAVDACVRILGCRRPSGEEVGAALARARGYKVSEAEKRSVESKKEKERKVRYYALLPEVDLRAVIEERFREADSDSGAKEGEKKQGEEEGEVPKEMKDLWSKLTADNRIAPIPHITLAHSNNLTDPCERALWESCRALSSLPHSPNPLFTFRLRHLISDGRVMCISVEDLRPQVDPGEDTSAEALRFVRGELREDVKRRLHVTVGTREEGVKPFEARGVVERWREGRAGKEVKVIELRDVVVRGRVKGLMG